MKINTQIKNGNKLKSYTLKKKRNNRNMKNNKKKNT